MADQNPPVIYILQALRRFRPVGNEICDLATSGKLSPEGCYQLGQLINQEVDWVERHFSTGSATAPPPEPQASTPNQASQAAAAAPILKIQFTPQPARKDEVPGEVYRSQFFQEPYSVLYQTLRSPADPVIPQKISFSMQVRVVTFEPLAWTLPSAFDILSPEVFTDVAGPADSYRPANLDNLENTVDVRCTVTHMPEGQREFCLVPEEWWKDLDALTKTLQTVAKELQDAHLGLPGLLHQGMPCLCFFPENNEWHRAEIVDPHSRLVRFVDYGRIERSMGPGELLPIPKMLMELHQFAIRCYSPPPHPMDSQTFKRRYYEDSDQVVVNFGKFDRMREPFVANIRSWKHK